MRKILVAVLFSTMILPAGAQLMSQQKSYSHVDSLRGGISKARAWWDVLHYDLHVQFNEKDSTLRGHNVIQYKVLTQYPVMQIDLMKPLICDSIVREKHKLTYKKDGNAYMVDLPAQPENSISSITAYYHGKPQVAARPPWDGGVIWAKDKKGRPWISVACQGLGASVWYPCKDHQYDEPDSASIHITVPSSLVAVSNGRLKKKTVLPSGYVTYQWSVVSPINNYNIIPYIGHYVNFTEVYPGEKGNLDMSYWVLDYNLEQAHSHLSPNANKTMKSFEYWFGPYPFYEDGYKLVDAPHLGMEHQSAVAYGNKYMNGYLGHDLSGTGWGMKWDFIVVHESAHEWFGNNISTKDLADMWVHESFANYSETLFTTSEFGVEAGNDYIVGSRRGIRNDVPVIGKYGVNEEGSGDMYPKGGNMLHTIRQVVNDDEKFRQILRGLGKEFYHQTVTTNQIEKYISEKAGFDFSKVFDQYLRTTQIPSLNYSVKQEKEATYLYYRWENCVPGFKLPVKVTTATGETQWLKATTNDQRIKIKSINIPGKIVDRNFYVDENRQGK
jgi:aminopeptidase N